MRASLLIKTQDVLVLTPSLNTCVVTGADINAICQEAGMHAVRENRYIVLPKE
jgi:ATP-dependent 26S proteasome regulatory subunit